MGVANISKAINKSGGITLFPFLGLCNADTRFRLEPHAGKWAGFTCALPKGRIFLFGNGLLVFGGDDEGCQISWLQFWDHTLCKIGERGRDGEIGLIHSQQGPGWRAAVWQVPKPELQRYFAMTLGQLQLVLSEWVVGKKTRRLQWDYVSICPKESGNI